MRPKVKKSRRQVIDERMAMRRCLQALLALEQDAELSRRVLAKGIRRRSKRARVRAALAQTLRKIRFMNRGLEQVRAETTAC